MASDASHAFGEILSAEQQLAIAYSHADFRDKLSSYFAFDRRLGQIVAKASEPMLAQMRLAWWREMLAKPLSDRPQGDAVLDAIGCHWSGCEEHLTLTVDAWERALQDDALSESDANVLVQERSAPFRMMDENASDELRDRVWLAGQRWAAAEFRARLSETKEREIFADLANGLQDSNAAIPKHLRGIAVLEALADRALQHDHGDMMEGRGAALVAFRVGLFGR